MIICEKIMNIKMIKSTAIFVIREHFHSPFNYPADLLPNFKWDQTILHYSRTLPFINSPTKSRIYELISKKLYWNGLKLDRCISYQISIAFLLEYNGFQVNLLCKLFTQLILNFWRLYTISMKYRYIENGKFEKQLSEL